MMDNNIVNSLNNKFLISCADDSTIFNDIKNVTIKEDGVLVYVTKDFFEPENKTNWIVTIKNHKTTDKLPFDNKMSYLELFLSIIEMEVNTFVDTLVSQVASNDIIGFCFEMCSPKIRNIKVYDNDALFLLSAYDNDMNEVDINNITLFGKITQLNNIQSDCTTYKQFLGQLVNIALKNISIEGLVVCQNDGTRYKIISPYFTVQIILKYMGWSYSTPQLMVPLILDNLENDIVHNVKQCIDGDTLFSFQMQEISKFYNGKINYEYNCVLAVVNDLMDKKIVSKEKYISYIEQTYPKINANWHEIFNEIFEELKNIKNKKSLPFNEVFKKHMIINLNKIFKQ